MISGVSTKLTPSERFWPKVDIHEGCWLWTAGCDSMGYGQFKDGKLWKAHRWIFNLVNGCVPPELDHLCRVKTCVNPDHLDAVTHAENMKRGYGGAAFGIRDRCSRGHPYLLGNWYLHPDGYRVCLTCRRLWRRQSHCKYGHPLPPTDPNNPRGWRRCSQCTAESTACRRGHPYMEGSYRIRSWGARECLVCIKHRREEKRHRNARMGGGGGFQS
jgi:hypothetical protein